jgi:hypothetical protein
MPEINHHTVTICHAETPTAEVARGGTSCRAAFDRRARSRSCSDGSDRAATRPHIRMAAKEGARRTGPIHPPGGDSVVKELRRPLRVDLGGNVSRRPGIRADRQERWEGIEHCPSLQSRDIRDSRDNRDLKWMPGEVPTTPGPGPLASRIARLAPRAVPLASRPAPSAPRIGPSAPNPRNPAFRRWRLASRTALSASRPAPSAPRITPPAPNPEGSPRGGDGPPRGGDGSPRGADRAGRVLQRVAPAPLGWFPGVLASRGVAPVPPGAYPTSGQTLRGRSRSPGVDLSVIVCR